MATVSSLGVGSGLDLEGMLTKLMSVEKQPLLKMQQKEASYQARISALGSLQGALSSLQGSASNLVPSSTQTLAEKYTAFGTSVADSSVASASTSTGAVAGTYSLEVTALAKAHRLASSAFSGGSTSSISQGTLTLELGTLSGGAFTADSARTKTITITSSNNTLAGLRDAVNASGADVTATIVTGQSGAQLMLTSNSTGNKNVMRLSGLTGFDFNPVAATGSMTQSAASGGQAASDASAVLNGIAITSSTNTVTGALDGVTLTLSKTNVGSPTSVTITKNTNSPLTAALNSFVQAYNEANNTMRSMGAYDANTKQAGALQGQAVLRSAQSKLRDLVFNTSAPSGIASTRKLNDIGVTMSKDGSLTLDGTKLSAAITADFAGVASLVSKVGTAFKTGIDGLVGTSGSIPAATASANALIKELGKRETALSDRLTAIDARYRKQFTALDSTVASMNKTSTYLTQQLANLPSASSSK